MPRQERIRKWQPLSTTTCYCKLGLRVEARVDLRNVAKSRDRETPQFHQGGCLRRPQPYCPIANMCGGLRGARIAIESQRQNYHPPPRDRPNRLGSLDWRFSLVRVARWLLFLPSSPPAVGLFLRRVLAHLPSRQ